MSLRNLHALILIVAIVDGSAIAAEPAAKRSVFVRDNLVAWCIVPFDAKKRGPAERAKMLERLCFKRVAYDWRDEHVPTFEQEILEYKKHGIEFFAFWSWHDAMAPLIRKHGIKPQIWITCPSPADANQEQKVEAAAKELAPLVEKTRGLGLTLGLYNHGGWGGEPANLVAICEYFRKAGGSNHVGIVYNFHHGHGHINDFAESLAAMKPYMLCLNLNGMNDNENPIIMTIGAGKHDEGMLRIVRDSGYDGPIGMIHHREELDAEGNLRQNIDGFKMVLGKLGDVEALKTFDR